jgi:predicted transposase YdaD
MLAVKNSGMREAVDTLYEISADDKVRAEYEMRQKAWRDRMSQFDGYYRDGLKEGRIEGRIEGKLEGIQEGLEKGKQEGIQEGLKKGKLEIAAVMKKNGIPVEQIILCTGLSLDEIAEL